MAALAALCRLPRQKDAPARAIPDRRAIARWRISSRSAAVRCLSRSCPSRREAERGRSEARGARVIATSSSDEKLARAAKLGADFLINYKTTPQWGARARELTDGRGVDVVVEVGGENTLAQSLDAARVGGSVVVIGVLGGFASPLFLPVLFGKNLRLIGISVGSRAQFQEMADAIGRWKLKPVIDRVFPFEGLPEALALMQAGGHFGKLVVKFD